MPENLAMTSAYDRPTDRPYGPAGRDYVDFTRKGTGNPRLQFAFVLAKPLPVHLEAAGGVFPVKILNFVCGR